MHIMTDRGWQPLGGPILMKPEAPFTEAELARHDRHEKVYEKLFFSENGEDMRWHPHFGEGIHRYG